MSSFDFHCSRRFRTVAQATPIVHPKLVKLIGNRQGSQSLHRSLAPISLLLIESHLVALSDPCRLQFETIRSLPVLCLLCSPPLTWTFIVIRLLIKSITVFTRFCLLRQLFARSSNIGSTILRIPLPLHLLQTQSSPSRNIMTAANPWSRI